MIHSSSRFLTFPSQIRPLQIRPLQIRYSLAWTVIGAILVLMAGFSEAQTEPSEPSITELKKNYTDSIEALRQSVKDLKRNGLEYYYGKSDTALEYKTLWEESALDGAKAYHEIHLNAFALFLALDQPEEQLTRVVYLLNRKFLEAGRLETNYLVTRKLYAMFPDDKQMQVDMARVAVLTNDFEVTNELSKYVSKDNPEFSPVERSLWHARESLAIKHARELNLQSEESKADDLPRVELTTTKGTIVLELFENEAPETVGNFINLVEAGFYENILFNFVLKNLIAVTGGVSMTDDGRATPQPIGYTIYDESQRSDARYHFRGTIAMNNPNNTVNSGHSMFYFSMVPSALDRENQTVFGRVISGMKVVEQLQVTTIIDEEEGGTKDLEGIVWDKIISAKVLRKRDHEYIPNIVKK